MLNPNTFKCSRCGKCCKTYIIKVSKKDIKRITSKDYEENYFLMHDPMSLDPNKFVLKKDDGKCVFLKKKNNKYLCGIYKIRPLICQKYPFFKRNVESCKPEQLIQKSF